MRPCNPPTEQYSSALWLARSSTCAPRPPGSWPPLPLPAFMTAGYLLGFPPSVKVGKKLAEKFKSYWEETGESTFGQAAFPHEVRLKGTWKHLLDTEEAPPPCGKQSVSRRRGVFYVLALIRQNVTPNANICSSTWRVPWLLRQVLSRALLRGRAAVPVREQQGGARRVLQETAVAASPRKLTTCTELARIKRNQPRRQGDSGASVKVLPSQRKVDHLGLGSASRYGGTTRRGCGLTARLFLRLRRNSIRSRASGRSWSSEPLPGSSSE